MDDTKILKQQMELAPEEIRTFVAQKKWSPVVDQIVNKYGFLPEQKISLENEVLFVLLGLDTSKNFQENIRTELVVSELVSGIIDTDIRNRIFKQFDTYLPTEEEKPDDIPTNVPAVKTSATVLEVAPSNLPMVEAGEVAHDTTPEEKAFMNTSAPTSAPTPNEPQKENSRPNIVSVPQYTDGVDPYREPAN